MQHPNKFIAVMLIMGGIATTADNVHADAANAINIKFWG